MKRFEQIIEDQYKRLGIALEADDETDPLEDDNVKQNKELDQHKQYTDRAEDDAHDANMGAQTARQKYATVATTHHNTKAQKTRDKLKKLEQNPA